MLVCDCGILVRYKLSGYLAGSHTFALIVFSHFIPTVSSWRNQERTVPLKVSTFSAKFLSYSPHNAPQTVQNPFWVVHLLSALLKETCLVVEIF